MAPAALLVLVAVTGPLLAAHPLDKPVAEPYAEAAWCSPPGR